MTYEEKCLTLDKTLAELLGYTYGNFMWFNPKGEVVKMPRWTQHSGAVLRLAVEYDCYPCNCASSIVVEKPQWDTRSMREYYSQEEVADFPDKLSAVRYAIVQAAINKLSKHK